MPELVNSPPRAPLQCPDRVLFLADKDFPLAQGIAEVVAMAPKDPDGFCYIALQDPEVVWPLSQGSLTWLLERRNNQAQQEAIEIP